MTPANCWPGMANQKSVPGLEQPAVTRPPGPVCSASRPWAMAPVAWIITPPGVTVGWEVDLAPLVDLAPGPEPEAAAAAGTLETDSVPGRDSRVSGAPVVPSLLMVA